MNKDKDQQDRTIQGQDSEPGKVWQESDKSQYTGQHDKDTGDAGIRGGFDETKPEDVNEQIDESQWQGNRFGQGGFGSGGSSNS